MMTRITVRACLVLMLLSLPVLISAQVSTTGRLSGVVTDSKAALVPKAEIVATQDETKAEIKATANGDGEWAIPSVPTGTYTITVSSPNLKQTILKDVKVFSGQVATANSVLEPGGASEQVIVAG